MLASAVHQHESAIGIHVPSPSFNSLLPHSSFQPFRLLQNPSFGSLSHIQIPIQFSSVQFTRSVMSDLFWTHESQHNRLPCPSSTPGVHPNSCPLSRWCHPAISFSVVPFSSCPQSFPASGSFQMSQLFASGGQSIGVSASISVLPMNIQD